MSVKIRLSKDRGHADYGWLNTYHTFSFADYYDPQYMGFRAMRVLNDDVIGPGRGFDAHPHKDMEIISYVVEGELAHKDSMGNGSVIKAGNLQRMTAGTGVRHSEFNPSAKNKARLLQIWILPDKKGLNPSYQEITVDQLSPKDGLTLVASFDGKDNVIKVHQDIYLYRGKLGKGGQANYSAQKGRGLWFQMVKGKALLNGQYSLEEGDGAAIEDEKKIIVSAPKEAEFLLFDLG